LRHAVRSRGQQARVADFMKDVAALVCAIAGALCTVAMIGLAVAGNQAGTTCMGFLALLNMCATLHNLRPIEDD
jgi:heme A synthase